MDAESAQRLRETTQRGVPLGSRGFVKALERHAGRCLALGGPGCPRRQKAQRAAAGCIGARKRAPSPLGSFRLSSLSTCVMAEDRPKLDHLVWALGGLVTGAWWVKNQTDEPKKSRAEKEDPEGVDHVCQSVGPVLGTKGDSHPNP